MQSPPEDHARTSRILIATGALLACVVLVVAGGLLAGGPLLERAALRTGDPEGRAASAELNLSLEIRAASETTPGSTAGPPEGASDAPSLDAAILRSMDDSGVLGASAPASGPAVGPDSASPQGDSR